MKKLQTILVALLLALFFLSAAAAEDTQPARLVAVTVDDGPDGAGCEACLRICRENGIPVTFFVVGQNIAGHRGQLRDMLDAGCEIGNHSWSHTDLTALDPDAVVREFADTNQEIAEAVPGTKVRFARAPYFAYSDKALAAVNAPLIDCSRAESDSDQYEQTLQTLLGAEDGDIILLHCWNTGSVRALEEAVPQMLADGVEFVTVSELFARQGVTPVNGKVYRSVKPNLQGNYRAEQVLFENGALTSGDWNSWQSAADLNKDDVKRLRKGQAIGVRYESTAAPCLILMSWSGGPDWVQLNPSSDDGAYAIYTWEDITAAFGSLDKLDSSQVRPWGTDVTVLAVELLLSD